jgi:hypothetical protein
MSGAALDLYIEQGDDWTPIWTLRFKANAQPMDLTGYTARMQIRSSYSATATLVDLQSATGGIALGGVNGTIQPKLTDTQTMAFFPVGGPAPNPVNVKVNDRPFTLVGAYDLKLTSPAGNTLTVAGGRVYCSPDVTR